MVAFQQSFLDVLFRVNLKMFTNSQENICNWVLFSNVAKGCGFDDIVSANNNDLRSSSICKFLSTNIGVI